MSAGDKKQTENEVIPQNAKAFEDELKLARERFNIIFENTTVSIWDYYFDKKQIVQPSRSKELHGFDTVIENVPESLIESGFVHPDYAQAFREMYNKLFAGEHHAEGVFRVQTADRKAYWYEYIRYNSLFDENGVPYAAIGMSTDVSEEMENKAELEKWKGLVSGTLEERGAVIEFDLTNNKLVGVDNSLLENNREFLGYEFDNYIDKYISQFVFAQDRANVRGFLKRDKLLANYLDGKRVFTLEYRMQAKDSIYWIKLSIRLVNISANNTIRLFMLHTDITKEKENAVKIKKMAESDSVTNLLNYRAFTEKIHGMLRQFPDRHYMLMLLDLDGFKNINDTYGHGMGDKILRYAGNCIEDLLNEFEDKAICCRTGGDEFIIVFTGEDREKAEGFAKALLKRVSEPHIEGITVTASIGIAVYPRNGANFNELDLAADRALYKIKHSGKNGFCFYDDSFREETGKLQRRQQFLSDTISGGMIGFYMGKGFPVDFIDDALIHWLGYDSEDEFIQHNNGLVENSIHITDREYVKKTIEHQLAEKNKYTVDFRMCKKDGSFIWIHNIGEKIIASNSKEAVSSVCYDITAEKEHDNLIQRLVADANGAIGLYRMEEDGRLILLYASEGLCKLGDRSDDEYEKICDNDAMKSVYEKDRASVLETMQKAVYEDTVTSASYRIPQKSGAFVWITGTFSKFGEDKGRPVLRAVYVPLPIQYELQLQTLESDTIAVYVIDKHTKELYYANNTSFRLYGVSSGNIADKTCYELYYNSNKPCENCILKLYEKNGKKSFTHSLGDKILNIEVQEKRWNGKDIVIIYGRDVTEQTRNQIQQEELLNRIPTGVCLYRITKSDYETLTYNDMLIKILGYQGKKEDFNPDMLLQKNLHKEDYAIVGKYLRLCREKPGEEHICKFRVWSEEKNAYIWIEANSNSIKQGEEIMIYATYTDITESYNAQVGLKNSWEAIKAIIKYGNISLWTYDLDTKTLEQEYSEIGAYGTEVSAENIPDSYIESGVIHPEDAEIFRACYERILSGDDTSECIVRVSENAKIKNKYVWLHIYLVRQKNIKERRAIGLSFSVDQEFKSIKQLEQTKTELQKSVKKLTFTQKNLKQSQEMMEAACSFADIWVFSYDVENKIAYTGENLQKNFGFASVNENYPDNLLGSDMLLPEYMDLYKRQFDLLKNGKKEITFDVEVRLLDNKIHWLRFKGQILKNQNVDSKMAVISAQIIDTEKAMEARLELEQKKVRENQKNLIYYYVTNLSKGTVVEYRGKSMDAPLYPENVDMDIFTAQGRENLAFEEDKQRLANIHKRERLLDNYNKGIMQEEYNTQFFNSAEEKIVWTRNTMKLLANPSTGDILLYEYVYDISEDEILSAMLKMEVDYGYEVMGNLFVRVDQFTFLDIDKNSGYSELRCLKFADYVRDYADKYMVEEDIEAYIDHYNRLIEIASEPNVTHSEVLYRTKANDGSIRYHKDDNYFYDKEKGIFLLTRREYTDVVRAEEKEKQRLLEALENAKAADKAKNDFMARMSHDMRTPMNAILGMTHLATDVVEKKSAVAEYIEQIEQSSRYLLGVINDILEMSRIESGKAVLNFGWYKIRDISLPVINMIEPLMERQNITFEYDDVRTKFSNYEIRVDIQKTQQMLMNILNNACKFTPKGGKVSLHFKNISLDTVNCIVTEKIIIADTGCGMSEEFLTRIFTPFEQERLTGNENIAGTGLGLSIARSIARQMGGDITVESELGKGSVFTIIFTYHYRLVDEESIIEEKREENLDCLKGLRIMLVEDNALNAKIAAKLLEKKGIIVETVNNGKEAVELFENSKLNEYDYILMDIRMPVMDGLEATKRIRKMNRADAKTVPIAAMSANAYEEDRKMSFDAGMNEHLSKPVEPKVLYEAIARLVKA